MRENGPGSRSPFPAAGGDPGIHSPVQDVQWERAGTENLVVEGLDVHLRGQFLLCPAAQFEYFELDQLGLGSGIRDKFGHELEFPSAFQQSRRDGKPRGIVKIKYGGQA